MKLWLLRPVDGAAPWEPWYDKAFGFVVRAESEGDARALVGPNAGDEWRNWASPQTPNPWLDPTLSTCVELTADGESGVVITDFHSA